MVIPNNLIIRINVGLSSFSGTAFFLSEDRQNVLDFIKSFNPYGTKFILKKPSMSFIENIFLMTFTKEVWIASLVVLTIFGIALYVLLNWEASKLNQKVS